MSHPDDCPCVSCEADRVDWAIGEIGRLVELVRWLALTYGDNLPIFHGAHKDELRATYLAAVVDAENYRPTGHWSTTRPEPAAPMDWGDIEAEHITVDDRGNTVRTP